MRRAPAGQTSSNRIEELREPLERTLFREIGQRTEHLARIGRLRGKRGEHKLDRFLRAHEGLDHGRVQRFGGNREPSLHTGQHSIVAKETLEDLLALLSRLREDADD